MSVQRRGLEQRLRSPTSPSDFIMTLALLCIAGAGLGFIGGIVMLNFTIAVGALFLFPVACALVFVAAFVAVFENLLARERAAQTATTAADER